MQMDTVMWFIFLGIAVAGYFLCAAQLKIIRKEVWNWGDRLKCGFFGFFFAAGISVIVGMGVIFASGDPELNTTGEPQVTLSVYMPLVMFIILGYLLVYPLVDFLFLANSEKAEGLTPFQLFLERKAIDRVKKPASYLVAVGLYVGLVLLPPFFLQLFLGKNAFIIWLSWGILIPIALIAYYGAMGFISGYYNVWNHLPNMGRSLFEPPDRMMQDFKDGAVFRILFGIMTFVYVWTWVSLFQTIGIMLGGGPLVNTAGAAASVFMVLLFGIVGYFSRFWGRKVKFRTRDVLFAAYIIAAVGVNVMINFIILNQNPLYATFAGSSVTRPLVSGATEPWGSVNPNPTLDYTWLVPAAIIEETVLVIVITYHFVHKNDPFLTNTSLSLITTSRQIFDPIPLFNFVRSRDERIQAAAHSAIVEVYSRLPNRKDQDFTKPKFINPLMDGVCDPNPKVFAAAMEGLRELVKSAGKEALPIILEALASPNIDKKYPVATTLLESNDEVVGAIPKKNVLQLLHDKEWRLRQVATKIISRRLDVSPGFVSASQLIELIDDPDFGVQGEILKTLVKIDAPVPAS
ncbi:MAG: HEAT repeat domain-containing protein, partial [Promethearchaeota archaeon]